MPTPTSLKPLDALPRTPASDMKRLGWRGVMKVVAHNGRVLVTNHDEPEAVILPVAEYARLLELLREAADRDEAALDALRRRFDERLASLKAPGAGKTLRGLVRKPLALEGEAIAGDGH
jgi:prevent-host-death family protein